MALGRFLKRTKTGSPKTPDQAGQSGVPETRAAQAAAGQDAASPNPMTNLILADVALRSGGQFLRHAVERALLGRTYTPEQARNIVKGRNMAQTLVGTAIARVATRSVPGALIVGGGLLAKTLYDRRRRNRAASAAEGAAQVAEQAAAGAAKD